jgi:hypothetical protein
MKALQGVQNSYNEVMMGRKQHCNNSEIPSPEYVNSLLAAPEYERLGETLFASFLQYLVKAELMVKQEDEQIMNFWKKSRESASKEKPWLKRMTRESWKWNSTVHFDPKASRRS